MQSTLLFFAGTLRRRGAASRKRNFLCGTRAMSALALPVPARQHTHDARFGFCGAEELCRKRALECFKVRVLARMILQEAERATWL